MSEKENSVTRTKPTAECVSDFSLFIKKNANHLLVKVSLDEKRKNLKTKVKGLSLKKSK